MPTAFASPHRSNLICRQKIINSKANKENAVKLPENVKIESTWKK